MPSSTQGPAPPSTAPAGPLVACEHLRVDVEGVPAIDGLTLRAHAAHLLLLGAHRAIFDALTGVASIARGALRIRGVEPASATKQRLVAGAPLDPPLPPRWTLREYVVWSARLSGLVASDAAKNADDAIAKLQLGAMATTPFAKNTLPHARRAAVVAGAFATGAPLLVLEDPLGGLPEEVAHTFARILVTGLEGKEWIIVAPRVSLTSPLAMTAEEAIVVGGNHVDAQGAPAEIAAAERRFRLRVHGPIESLAQELAERGATLRIDGAHVLVDLGASLTTAELAALCAAANVAIVELTPIARALS